MGFLDELHKKDEIKKIGNFWDFTIKLQIENQHLKEHIPENRPCFESKEEHFRPMCVPDPKKILCPRCFNYSFEGYQISDENDTYTGMKCRACKLDYSLSH